MIKDNNRLGTFDLTGIAKSPRGQPQIEVTFSIDVNGLLSVSAVEKGSTNEKRIEITNDKGRLSKEDIDRMLKEAEDFKEKDTLEADRITARNNLESRVYGLKNHFDKDETLNQTDKEMVFGICEEVITWLETSTEANTQDYLDKLNELETKVKDLIDVASPRDEL